MPAPHTVETKSCQTSSARPKLRCTWYVNPTSGRPVARWALEQPEPIRSAVCVQPHSRSSAQLNSGIGEWSSSRLTDPQALDPATAD